MNYLIEKLQNKNVVRAFGLMTPEEQEYYKKVGRENCLSYLTTVGWVDMLGTIFNQGTTYAIKPDYKPEPEPEYVNLEIVVERDNNIKWLAVCREGKHTFLPHAYTHLHCLPSLPGFIEFWTNSGDSIRTRRIVPFDDVASKNREGNKVIAKFRSP